MNYIIWLSYDGTRYDGWQKQGNTDKTIQGKLEHILERLDGGPVEVRGSGRTDAGVHAQAQVADFHLKENHTPDEVMEYLNKYLPEDIAVWKAELAPERFHSRLNAVRKTYRYQIEMASKKDVFRRNYYYGLGRELDIEAMERAAQYLIGTRDFKSFCGNKKMKKSSVRTLESVRFLRVDDTRLHISFTGNGFLQQMVRILAGTLIEVGEGRRRPEDMTLILDAKDRQAAGYTAPPEGLFLEKVEYGELV